MQHRNQKQEHHSESREQDAGRWSTIVAWPREPVQHLVIQKGPLSGGEAAKLSRCAEVPAVDEAHTLGPAEPGVSSLTRVEGKGGRG